VDIIIHAIIGDTLLSSVAWLLSPSTVPGTTSHAPGLTGLDLYDSCHVRLSLPSTGTQPTTIFSIPSARVLTGVPPSSPSDPESSGFTARIFPPRGGSNDGQNIAWWMWIPLGPDRWLQLRTDDMKMLGKRRAEVVNDEGVTKKLMSGELFVGINDVKEVKEIVG
jgi:hypothetical protein